MNLRRQLICLIFAIFVSALPIAAQEGMSSAGVSRSRTLSTKSILSQGANSQRHPETNRIAFTPPDEVAVEEFVNYHKHRLPLPKANQAVALDLRWGNDLISPTQPNAVLQIGFATAHVSERTDLRPINLSLVIDKSGSMQAADKMSRVKDALCAMIRRLRPEDTVSVVVFDTAAEVLQPARRVGDGRELERTIQSIEPNGSTNLHAGLMLGYREAQKSFRKNSTNRVILLTDGIANVGVVEPKKIAAESSEFNATGIDVSTIGVGVELDEILLRTLAKTGRGLYHFVAENEDIEKVFVNEVQSLMSPVARRVKLDVDFDSNLTVEKIYGYDPKFSANGFTINLEDFNNGVTGVVLTDFLAKNASTVRVKLSYFDFAQQRNVVETQNITLKAARDNKSGALLDFEVKKNYAIANLAQSLAEMKTAWTRGEKRRAETILNAAVSNVYRDFPNMDDKDISYILKIVEDYQINLRTHNRNNKNCQNCE